MALFDDGYMSVKDWVITLVITLIPIVGLVFILIWAFSDRSYNPIRKNWAIAVLIVSVAIAVIYSIVSVILWASSGKTMF